MKTGFVSQAIKCVISQILCCVFCLLQDVHDFKLCLNVKGTSSLDTLQ